MSSIRPIGKTAPDPILVHFVALIEDQTVDFGWAFVAEAREDGLCFRMLIL